MAESGTDLDSWNWTLTGTGLVSRIEGIGLFLDPRTGTYVSESDRWDRTRCRSGNFYCLAGSGVLTAWLYPGS